MSFMWLGWGNSGSLIPQLLLHSACVEFSLMIGKISGLANCSRASNAMWTTSHAGAFIGRSSVCSKAHWQLLFGISRMNATRGIRKVSLDHRTSPQGNLLTNLGWRALQLIDGWSPHGLWFGRLMRLGGSNLIVPCPSMLFFFYFYLDFVWLFFVLIKSPTYKKKTSRLEFRCVSKKPSLDQILYVSNIVS